jgi:succinate dehydrogenase/fumarate reductase flavoprotein subunit
MERVLAPTKRAEGYDWKDLSNGVSTVLRTYFGEYVSDELIKIGQMWLNELEQKEAKELVAKNPHELMRGLETLDHLTVAQVILESAANRKASSRVLNLNRLDYRDVDPPEWNKLITIKQVAGKPFVGVRPFKYWLLPPYAPTYRENYEKHTPW